MVSNFFNIFCVLIVVILSKERNEVVSEIYGINLERVIMVDGVCFFKVIVFV